MKQNLINLAIAIPAVAALFFGVVWLLPILSWCLDHLLLLVACAVLVPFIPSIAKGLGYLAVCLGLVLGGLLTLAAAGAIIPILEAGLGSVFYLFS